MQFFASRTPTQDNPAIFESSNSSLSGWDNQQLGKKYTAQGVKDVELYGTSWMFDLMVAKQFAPTGWVQNDSIFMGSVDANLGVTPKTYAPAGVNGIHSSHDLGMAMDLDVSHYIEAAIQNQFAANNSSLTVALDHPGQWSMADAQKLLDAMIHAPSNRQDLALADFFSLYTVTQKGASGSRDALASHIKGSTNQEAVLNALFGDGTQANSLINGVIIGGSAVDNPATAVNEKRNTYPAMRYALQQLGFVQDNQPSVNTMPSVQNMFPHQNHFHIYLQPPKLEEIHTTNALMVADAGNTTVLATASDALLLADAASKTITPEIVRKVNEALANSCTEAESLRFVEGRKAHPGGLSASYAVVAKLKYDYGVDATGVVKAVITQQPAHGKVTMVGLDDQTFPATPLEVFQYTPDKDFLGNDKVVFEVTVNGQKFRVNFVVMVVHGSYGTNCEPDVYGGTLTPEVQIAIEDMQYLQDANAPEAATSWQSLFAQNEQIINSMNLSFADLSGGALGQTIGDGITASITLDTNASGYGWFIDPTPGSNEEWLPTSNPNEWVAKAGSAAAGKMDMLSVLMHEYGHALGINHSADSNDYMGTTLQAGVRRLPSAEEMALMQQLVGQVKATFAESTPTPSLPLQGGGGLPALPLGSSFIGFLGLLRGSRYGGVGIAPDVSTLVTQYDWAANPTLTNGNLTSAAGWSTQGGVEFGTPSTGSARAGAVLREVSNSQTRLSQAFLLGANDRYLSFTLSGTALDDLTGAPDDAFQVALLDANTGLSLLGGTGLTRTDAFLNLQADGTQNMASCVTCITNADGSRTYQVDLAGIPAGVAANLSFDLIGFGANGSHITVSDVQLIGNLPQLHDDAAVMQEDGVLTFDPYAQLPAGTGQGIAAQPRFDTISRVCTALGVKLVAQPVHS